MKKINLVQMQKIEKYILNSVVKICDENSIGYSMYAGSILGTVRHKGPIPWDSDIDMIISIDDAERFEKAMSAQLPSPLFLDSYSVNKKNKYFYPRVGIKGADVYWVHVDVFLYSALPNDKQLYHGYLQTAREKLAKYHRKTNVTYTKKNAVTNAVYTSYHFLRSLFVRGSKESLYNDYMKYSKKYSLADAEYTTELGCAKYGDKKVFKKSYWENTVLADYADIKVRIPKESDDFLTFMYGDYMSLPSESERTKLDNFLLNIDDDLYNWCVFEHIFDF